MPEDAGASDGLAGESLSCVTCRSRKLRCDKVKPVCTRCAKVNGGCVYPESRRKPAFRRRNVRELEERLAQVEGLLRHAGGGGGGFAAPGSATIRVAGVAGIAGIAGIAGVAGIAGNAVGLDAEGLASDAINVDDAFETPVAEGPPFQGRDSGAPDISLDDSTFTFDHEDPTAPAEGVSAQRLDGFNGNTFGDELMGLGGVFEALPPFEVMECLNRLFFERQQQFALIIHPSRYLHAFYSPPHMRPPMCLQYAIWALASNNDPKYHAYHDIFYQRARRYADMDEMKGNGEHFISIAHAQTWCVLATDEAKSMMFTRAAMSCARAVRLAAMMGLHHLDSAPDESSPTLAPPQDWAELEERRRVFWGIFCIDSHCSISTGWPHLIDVAEATTHLPATEAAFYNGEPMETCTIHDAFKGEHAYSSFAGNIVVCHLFNLILKHAHRPKENDNPENYEYGEYWKRHRDIDNTLSNAFMFLPESFRLPENYRDVTAVTTNLNLHASIICLHHAALERIETHSLSEYAKRISQDRLSAAAQEIVNIMKLTSHLSSSPRTPLGALSLFCAASVYMYFCKESNTPTNVDNLDFMLSAMEAIGRTHSLTRSFLRQALLDIERNGVQDIVQLPRVARLSRRLGNGVSHNVPLLARTRLSRHSEAQPPIAGLPIGRTRPRAVPPPSISWPEPARILGSPSVGSGSGFGSDDHTHKRQRTATPSSNSSLRADSGTSTGLPLLSSHPSIRSEPISNHSDPKTTISHINQNIDPPILKHSTTGNAHKRIGVTIAPSILGNRGPKPFTTAGSEASQTKVSKGGMGSWELGGLCASAMADQWVDTTPDGDDSLTEFMYPDGIGLDRDGFDTNLGVDTSTPTIPTQDEENQNTNNIGGLPYVR
ncbi:putative binuclear zinc transcription factor [Rosellinia necatrix]|uniref:Putative binuclear zinc transcription factor n=1 Tax=Rosellinia necatrix TaxID=77044 RepID=A0A1W2TMT0_ROSNE|nr:putative binuclear zinc transcription factor [Rosellinia necatrix]